MGRHNAAVAEYQAYLTDSQTKNEAERESSQVDYIHVARSLALNLWKPTSVPVIMNLSPE